MMVRQACDRQFEYLNAQQGTLENDNGDEYWSNPHRGHDPNEMSDLVSLQTKNVERFVSLNVKTKTIDSDETLMQINITGSANLQKSIRLLCPEYIDIFSPTVREEPARVPPLSMKVDIDKWKDKRNRLSPRFLTRDKDADLRKQIALLKTLGVIEKTLGVDGLRVQSSAPCAQTRLNMAALH